MDVSQALEAMRAADPELYMRIVQSPLNKPLSEVVRLAGERDEVVAHAERFLRLRRAGDETLSVIETLVQRYGSK